MKRAVVFLVLSACDPIWQLDAKVTAPGGDPLEGAALAITCPDFGQAALTDARGDAVIGALGTSFPAGCTVTVARPGHATYTTTLEALCAPESIDDCHRVRHLDVVLRPL